MLPVSTEAAKPSWPIGRFPGAVCPRTIRLGTALLVLQAATAVAFPLIDPTNQDQVPTGTELTPPEAQDLQHQLQLANGLAAPEGGGWTFLPRFDLQEMLTDNVFEQNTPRQWDIGTFFSPGIGVAGNTPRLQLTLDYAPTLALYAHAGSLNALTEQLNGIGLVTMVPDLAYVDVRALAGVHSLYGGIGGLGTIGASASAASASAATVASLAGNSMGLNKSNEVQTDSLAISPYLLRRFGDYGTGKLGYSLSATQSNLLTGFASSPLAGGGGNGQTQVTNEEFAHFATGEFLGALQNVFDVDLQQSNSNTDAAFITATTGLQANSNSTPSTRNIVTDQVNYVVNRAITVFVSGGHENITYTGVIQPIDDLTWSIGTTLTPNSDSLLSVSYGHLNGFNSFSAYGHYELTARYNPDRFPWQHARHAIAEPAGPAKPGYREPHRIVGERPDRRSIIWKYQCSGSAGWRVPHRHSDSRRPDHPGSRYSLGGSLLNQTKPGGCARLVHVQQRNGQPAMDTRAATRPDDEFRHRLFAAGSGQRNCAEPRRQLVGGGECGPAISDFRYT